MCITIKTANVNYLSQLELGVVLRQRRMNGTFFPTTRNDYSIEGSDINGCQVIFVKGDGFDPRFEFPSDVLRVTFDKERELALALHDKFYKLESHDRRNWNGWKEIISDD